MSTQPEIPGIGSADLTSRLGRKAYRRELALLQLELTRIQQAYLTQGRSGVVVFEGWDASGKGGTIRRIAMAMDPRSFKVWPIMAPRYYYLERHYLLRFMERMPPRGAITVFDRSWYGRVLVERVEKLTPSGRWQAAYGEINEFEKLLCNDGARLVKIFFHISPEEQLRRFERRLRDPLKRWKLSYEDFRNRSHWAEYAGAIDDMFRHTHTEHAPWKLVPADNKRFARISAMREIVHRLGEGVDLSPPSLDDSVVEQAKQLFKLKPSLLASLRGRTE